MSVILATASYDHKIRFWEAPSGHVIQTLRCPDSQVNCLEITPNKQFLAAGCNPHIRLPRGSSRARFRSDFRILRISVCPKMVIGDPESIIILKGVLLIFPFIRKGGIPLSPSTCNTTWSLSSSSRAPRQSHLPFCSHLCLFCHLPG